MQSPDAHAQSLHAEQLAARGNVRGSIMAWGDLFSSYFPQYG